MGAWCICLFMTKPSVHRACVPWFSMRLRDWSLKFTALHHLPSVNIDILALASRASTNKRRKKLRHKKKAVFTGLVTQGILAGHACKATCYRLSGWFFSILPFLSTAPMDFRVPPGYYTSTSVQDEGCQHNQAHSSNVWYHRKKGNPPESQPKIQFWWIIRSLDQGSLNSTNFFGDQTCDYRKKRSVYHSITEICRSAPNPCRNWELFSAALIRGVKDPFHGVWSWDNGWWEDVDNLSNVIQTWTTTEKKQKQTGNTWKQHKTPEKSVKKPESNINKWSLSVTTSC